MAESFKIKKRKKVTTWLRKTMLYGVLPAYLSILVVCGVFIFGFMVSSLPARVVEIVFYVCIGILIAVTFTVPVIIPLCRVKQALLDMENYDFSHYSPKETETFSLTLTTEKYYFTPSPFDDDEGIIELSGGKAADDYFSQFAPDRLQLVENLQDNGTFMPFYIFDVNNNYFHGSVEKRKEDGCVTVTVTEKPEITFDADGVHLGGQTFPYETCEAIVYAGFVQPYARASAGVYVILNEETAAVFAFGTRIMSIIDKHKIPVKNRETADFILTDPEKAFRRIGLRGKLKNSK